MKRKPKETGRGPYRVWCRDYSAHRYGLKPPEVQYHDFPSLEAAPVYKRQLRQIGGPERVVTITYRDKVA